MTGRARLWVIMECYGALPLMPPVVQSPFRLPRPPPRLLRVKTFDPQRIRTSWNDSNNYGKVASNRDTWDTWDTYNPIRGKSVGRSVYPPSFLLLLLVGRFILFFTRLVHRPTTDPPPTHHRPTMTPEDIVQWTLQLRVLELRRQELDLQNQINQIQTQRFLEWTTQHFLTREEEEEEEEMPRTDVASTEALVAMETSKTPGPLETEELVFDLELK